MANFERGKDPKSVLELGILQKAIKLLIESHGCIGMARFELGEDWDVSDLEGRIGEFLDDNGFGETYNPPAEGEPLF
jgi:hypothetical protein